MGQARNAQPDKGGFGENWRAAVIELAISYAVNHPLRLDCLAILIMRVASASEIAKELKISVPAAAHHIDGLYRDGVVEYVKTETGGRRRGGSEHYYRATALPEVTEEDWLVMPHDCRRQMAGRVLQAIVVQSLSALRCQTMEIDDDLNLGWQAIEVADEEGDKEIVDLFKNVAEQFNVIKTRNLERKKKSGKAGAVRIVANLSFIRSDPAAWHAQADTTD